MLPAHSTCQLGSPKAPRHAGGQAPGPSWCSHHTALTCFRQPGACWPPGLPVSPLSHPARVPHCSQPALERPDTHPWRMLPHPAACACGRHLGCWAVGGFGQRLRTQSWEAVGMQRIRGGGGGGNPRAGGSWSPCRLLRAGVVSQQHCSLLSVLHGAPFPSRKAGPRASPHQAGGSSSHHGAGAALSWFKFAPGWGGRWCPGVQPD